MNSSDFESLLFAVLEGDRYRRELIPAKSEFERVAGQIMDTDTSYEARMNAFHNWYILDRPLADVGATPLQHYCEEHAAALTADAAEAYREMGENVHSVFELLRFNGGRVLLRDLMSRRKHLVEGAEQLDSLGRLDLFNTRIFRHDGKEYLSNYIILHPHSVTKMIRGEAKKVRKAGLDPKPFLLRLLFFHSRWEQFAQMDVTKIYRFGGLADGRAAV